MPQDRTEERSRPLSRVLLIRFIAGEVTPDEAAAVQQWLADEPARRAELAELQQIWARAGNVPSEDRIDTLWYDLQHRMHEPALPAPVPARELHLVPSAPRRLRRWVAGLAAAGIAAAAAGVALRSESGRSPLSIAASSERVYSTARGQRGVVELADGSRVQLGVDSRIRVRIYDGGRREVRLEGEAIFDVVHDERRPFLVYAANAVTEDLGTRFGVRAYPSDSVVEVAVVSGKVALRPTEATASGMTAEVVLGSGDLGTLGSAAEPHAQRGVDVEGRLAWADRKLVFREATIEEVAAQLERWYDVDIVVADSQAAGRRVTLTLDAPSLAEALDAVVVPLGWRYERAGRRIVLRP